MKSISVLLILNSGSVESYDLSQDRVNLSPIFRIDSIQIALI